jgi:hypothetical protein
MRGKIKSSNPWIMVFLFQKVFSFLTVWKGKFWQFFEISWQKISSYRRCAINLPKQNLPIPNKKLHSNWQLILKNLNKMEKMSSEEIHYRKSLFQIICVYNLIFHFMNWNVNFWISGWEIKWMWGIFEICIFGKNFFFLNPAIFACFLNSIILRENSSTLQLIWIVNFSK